MNVCSILKQRHQPKPPRTGWRKRALVASAASVLAAGAVAGPAAAASTPPDAGANYSFSTLNNNIDVTFNQLLGINNAGQIAGYFGSGAAGHPNKGYLLSPPDGQGNYLAENFPGSVQTQVTGLNDRGDTVGFWSGQTTPTWSTTTSGSTSFPAIVSTR